MKKFMIGLYFIHAFVLATLTALVGVLGGAFVSPWLSLLLLLTGLYDYLGYKALEWGRL